MPFWRSISSRGQRRVRGRARAKRVAFTAARSYAAAGSGRIHACLQYLHACKHLPRSARGADSSTDAVAADLGVAHEARARAPRSRDFFAAVEEAGHHLHPGEVPAASSTTPTTPLTIGALSETLGLSVPAVSRAVDGARPARRGQAHRGPARPPLQAAHPHRHGRRTFERFAALRLAGVQALRGRTRPTDGARGARRRAAAPSQGGSPRDRPHSPERGQPPLVDARRRCASPCS